MIAPRCRKDRAMLFILVECAIIFTLMLPFQIMQNPSSCGKIAGPCNSTRLHPASSTSQHDAWPTFLHDYNRTGASTSIQYSSNSSWKFFLGVNPYYAVQSSPVLANGLLYIANPGHSVYCINQDTGAMVWNYATKDAVCSTPTVDNGRVYVGSDDSYLYCLDAVTSNLVWKYSYDSTDKIRSSPAIVNGHLFAFGVFFLFNLYISNGTAINWVGPSPGPGGKEQSAAIGSNLAIFAGGGNINGEPQMQCVNWTWGLTEWYTYIGNHFFSTPSVTSNGVYASGDRSLFRLNCSDGNILWNYTTKGYIESSSAIDNGHIFVGSTDHNLYCLDALTGKKSWNCTLNGSIHSSPAIGGGCVYVGCDDGKLYCVNEQTGALVKTYVTNGSILSSPALSDGCVYVASTDGYLYCWPMVQLPSSQLTLTLIMIGTAGIGAAAAIVVVVAIKRKHKPARDASIVPS